MFSAQMAQGGGVVEIRSKAADGSGTERTLIAERHNYHYPAWSPDGKSLTYLWGAGEKMVSLWMVPLAGDAKPVAIVQPPSPQFNISSYRISPDSHWLAYVSDESGQQEVYITSFPEGKGKWKVSATGGAYPAWRVSGKELFFESITNDFFVCPVAVKGSEIDVGTPQHLLHTNSPGIGISFDVSSDGKRLLVNRAEVASEVVPPLRPTSPLINLASRTVGRGLPEWRQIQCAQVQEQHRRLANHGLAGPKERHLGREKVRTGILRNAPCFCFSNRIDIVFYN